MMKTLSQKSLATLSILVALSLCSPTLFAQSCDPAIKQRAEQQMAKNIQEEAARAEAIYGGHLEQPDWMSKSDGLLTACMKGNWASFLDKVPVIAGFSAKEAAVKKACDKARDTVSQGAQSYQSILKTIEGYESTIDPYVSQLGGWTGQNGGVQLPKGTNGANGGGIDWGSLGGMIPGGGTTVPGVGPQPNNPRPNPNPNPKPGQGGVPGVTP